MSDPVITVEDVSKKFCRSLKRGLMYGAIDAAKSMVGRQVDATSLRTGEFWALKDVSLSIRRGETVGIIGINGSGKTTLLRLLTGIFPPDAGRITVEGRVGSLLAVGAGFHPYMTGRENIYLNGTILGMSRSEIAARFKEIVDFADISSALDTPVSAYSSGMRVRLGFAIAAHCDPDILLMDEVLSVGDITFRNKSLRRMYEFKTRGNSVVFVSHQMDQVKMLCERVVILDRGGVTFDGSVDEGCFRYEESSRADRMRQIAREMAGSYTSDGYGFRETGGGDVRFSRMGILGADGRESDCIRIDDPLVFFCDFEVLSHIEGLCFSVGIHDDRPDPIIWVMSKETMGIDFGAAVPGRYRLVVRFPGHHLVPGVYFPRVAIRNDRTSETYERAWANVSFRISSERPMNARGIVRVCESWELMREDL